MAKRDIPVTNVSQLPYGCNNAAKIGSAKRTRKNSAATPLSLLRIGPRPFGRYAPDEKCRTKSIGKDTAGGRALKSDTARRNSLTKRQKALREERLPTLFPHLFETTNPRNGDDCRDRRHPDTKPCRSLRSCVQPACVRPTDGPTAHFAASRHLATRIPQEGPAGLPSS